MLEVGTRTEPCSCCLRRRARPISTEQLERETESEIPTARYCFSLFAGGDIAGKATRARQAYVLLVVLCRAIGVVWLRLETIFRVRKPGSYCNIRPLVAGAACKMEIRALVIAKNTSEIGVDSLGTANECNFSNFVIRQPFAID